MAPDKAMFTTDVAVEDQDEIAQDSSCMLAHSQGTFGRVVDFWIDTTSTAPTKTALHIIYGTMCLFLAARTQEKQIKYRESTQESIVGWCVFRSTVWLELYGRTAECRTKVDVLPVVDSFQ